MNDMTIDEFGNKHNACSVGLQWAMENCKTGMMSEAWDKLREIAMTEKTAISEYFFWILPRAITPSEARKLFLEVVIIMPGHNNWSVVSNCAPFDVMPLIDKAHSYLSCQTSRAELDKSLHLCMDYIKEYREYGKDVATLWALIAVEKCLGLDYWLTRGRISFIHACLKSCACSSLDLDTRRLIMTEEISMSDLDEKNNALFMSQWQSSFDWYVKHVSRFENPFR